MTVKSYNMRLAKWKNYALGKSYQHVAQGVGRNYQNNSLHGYFNDLSGKADFRGRFGDDGIPLVRTDTHESFKFPIVIFQWGLGNWEKYLDDTNKNTDHKANVLLAADWATENMTSGGGWLCWHDFRRPVTSPFSAMAQGEGISLLCRAHKVTGNPKYADAAGNALNFMLNNKTAQLVRENNFGSSLEEYPGESLRSVLNGWIFALYGVYDYYLMRPDQFLFERLTQLVNDLHDALPAFNTGWWSTYDLSGNIASPFYHNLHVSQLRCLAITFPNLQGFEQHADIFEFQSGRKLNLAAALSYKTLQKLSQTSVGEMSET